MSRFLLLAAAAAALALAAGRPPVAAQMMPGGGMPPPGMMPGPGMMGPMNGPNSPINAPPGTPPIMGPNGMPVGPFPGNPALQNAAHGPLAPGLAPLAAGALILIQPNQQTYAVEKRQLIVTWQPADPTIALAALPPNLVIECYPEVPITVGGPFGFAALVRTDRGEFRYDIPKGWAGEQWNVVLREQGGSQVVAGQRFAIKPEGTPLAPTTNIAGNTVFTPGNPQGWPTRTNAAANTRANDAAVGGIVGLAAIAVSALLV
jgi:hypothetical protein